ncbi:MAG: F0F1 ATP synthase subunit B [Bacteroidetes bacterium]|jgi:F-type H+-transporting ATPase subunit b|nr:F0F1 ATP synthase subunit B [Bacteroidota bacterium]HQW46685.1 F0F1 ATP synthase subunit B [Chitinophagaceae bacterium]MBK7041034.1 F0F1 ATP synthase subunit B [Bacteroidota bacterium]MBK7587804.1 F0F1 ATP synthase subunit B [Bacteroidota bacterium]MBK8328881.1 F0F1 ATP synthase subunit B [Bacteroidota bacterium]
MDLLTPGFGLFFWTLIAFLTVFFLLKKFAWKPILEALNEREKNIADSIASAEKVRFEMASMKSEHETLLNQAREERTLLLKEAKETKEKIIGEAKEAAKEEANKIMQESRQQIEFQKNAAIIDVKNQIGTLVIEVAEKVLRKELANKEQQHQYINTLAQEIKLN